MRFNQRSKALKKTMLETKMIEHSLRNDEGILKMILNIIHYIIKTTFPYIKYFIDFFQSNSQN